MEGAGVGGAMLRRDGIADAARPARRIAGRFALLGPDAAEGIAGEWQDLANRAAEDNLFFTPDFAPFAMAAFGDGARLATFRAADGTLLAAAPVRGRRLGWIAPASALWTHDYGPLGVPLVARGRESEAVAGLFAGLGESAIVIPDMWLDGPVASAVEAFAAVEGRPLATVNARARAMLCRTGGQPVDCRAGLPLRRRKEYGRQMRRLGETGAVAIEIAAEAAEVSARFGDFLALEASGWKGRRGTAMARLAPVAAMARAIVTSAAQGGRARIVSLKAGERHVAMLVAFLSGRSAYTWKIAYDEDFARFSPGAQLMLEAGRLLAGDGVEAVDSCAEADHPMIDHLWKGRRRLGTLLVGPPGGGAMFRAAAAACRAEIAARAVARRALRRLRG